MSRITVIRGGQATIPKEKIKEAAEKLAMYEYSNESKNCHTLKLQSSFVDAVLSGEKNFEIRKNDRGFQKGDGVVFQAVDNGFEVISDLDGKVFEITYVMNGYGLENGYVVFGIKKITGATVLSEDSYKGRWGSDE